MYNAELKSRFVKDYTKSINTANVATTVFEAFEPYETSWNADLCTRDREELQPAIDDILALRSRSQWMSLTILKEYVKWCIAMKVPDACDGMLNIEAAGLAKVRRQMVSSPLHLQRVLDEVFDKESEETIDVTYRCYYWMAFGGIKEDDTLLVRASDIDFANMEIVYQDTHVPLYREALPAFHKAVELNSFCYKNPNYSRTITRDRVSGDTLMRGIRAVKKTATLRSILSKKSAKAIEDGLTQQQLSFYRVWMSGLFYRMYDRERAGIPVDFSEAATDFVADRTYVLNGRIKLEHKQNRIEKNYMEDYQRWKLAFSI